jgi:hypothetical protein
MLHGAIACELNREAKPASEIVLPRGCSGSNCLVNLPQDPLTALANEKRTAVDPVQDCGAGYFDPCAYRKSNPDIFVMQSAEDRAAKNTPCPLYGAR